MQPTYRLNYSSSLEVVLLDMDGLISGAFFPFQEWQGSNHDEEYNVQLELSDLLH